MCVGGGGGGGVLSSRLLHLSVLGTAWTENPIRQMEGGLRINVRPHSSPANTGSP